jgi:hypothetical protein
MVEASSCKAGRRKFRVDKDIPLLWQELPDAIALNDEAAAEQA